jgi:hypothetical protein
LEAKVPGLFSDSGFDTDAVRGFIFHPDGFFVGALGRELVSAGASSSIHLPAVAIDRVPIHLQICAWVTADDAPGVALNLTRSVVEQQHHVPILFIGDR